MAGRPRKLENIYSPPKSNVSFSEGHKSKGILDDFAVRKVIDATEGTIQKTPTNTKDIVNKEYVDTTVTNIVTADSTLTNNFMIRGDGGNRKIQDTKIVIDDNENLTEVGNISWSGGSSTNANTAYTHSQDNTQAHSDYLLNSATDVGIGLTLTGDNSSADTAYVPMVLYNTDDTPPAASGFPIGTLYVQYTA